MRGDVGRRRRLSAAEAAGFRVDLVRRLPALLRRLAGMPDYEGYVTHLRRCHPERPVPSRREFYAEYVAARYGDGPTRCC